MSRRHVCLTLGLLSVLCPVWARADAGTPLVWTATFHLFLGNALIGLCEGLLLARVFGLPKQGCVRLMIVANYLSAWIGVFLVPHLFSRAAADIYSGLWVTWLRIAATYLVTLVVEWPFVAMCFRKSPRWLSNSVKGSFLVQSASYAVLFGGYFVVSGTSLYTGMQVLRPEQVPAPRDVVMYFISSSDGDVYRSELGSFTDIKVATLGSTNYQDDHLELQESTIDRSRWDMTAALERHQAQVVVPNVSSKELIPDEQGRRTSQYYGWGSAPFQVGDATNSSWHFGWAHWPDVGMWARKNDGSTTVRVAFGTPLGAYLPYRVIHLPGDRALLQLDNQICLVDIPGRKIARIRYGYGMLAFGNNQILESNGSRSQSAERAIPTTR